MRTSCLSRTPFALALLALSLATAWAPSPQADEIPVVGQVINGTAGGAVPEGLSVALHIFSGMEETGAYTTTLAADNSFYFDGLVPEEGNIFVARVVYQDVTYTSKLVTFEPEQQEIALPVTVYETTDDPAAVQIAQMHMFISSAGDRVQVGEYGMVGNAGDRTYVGVEDPATGQRTTLNFTLPDDAEELGFDDSSLGDRFLERVGGFADTEAIQPGIASTEVLYSYQLPYREGMQVERTFEVPVASVVILLTGEGLALEGEGVVLGDTMDTQMGLALSYTAGPLAAGETLVFAIVGRQQAAAVPVAPSGSSSVRNTTRETSVGLMALAVAVVVAYWLWQSSASGSLPPQARPLLEAIAALDADFEMGQMQEGAYRKKRSSLKRRLRTLLVGEE